MHSHTYTHSNSLPFLDLLFIIFFIILWKLALQCPQRISNILLTFQCQYIWNLLPSTTYIEKPITENWLFKHFTFEFHCKKKNGVKIRSCYLTNFTFKINLVYTRTKTDKLDVFICNFNVQYFSMQTYGIASIFWMSQDVRINNRKESRNKLKEEKLKIERKLYKKKVVSSKRVLQIISFSVLLWTL